LPRSTVLDTISMKNSRKGLPISKAHIEQIFPKLTSAQFRRIARYGHIRKTEHGEIIYEQGSVTPSFFVVISSEPEVVLPSDS